jgi:hypothetical protein
MTALAEASFHGFRALVYDDPAFEDFFWSATPIGEIVGLNIGSRPASRTASRKIEDLRAIPWVFSWSQARFMLPGWYGFASGVERAGLSTGQLQDLAGGFDFFGALLSNMELALAQSHMGIAARYKDLSPDKADAQRIFDTIQREHDSASRSPWRSAAAGPAGQPAGAGGVGGPGRTVGRSAEPPAAGAAGPPPGRRPGRERPPGHPADRGRHRGGPAQHGVRAGERMPFAVRGNFNTGVKTKNNVLTPLAQGVASE